MKQYLIGAFFSLILVILITSLFLMSFGLGIMDGCRDSGFETFAIGTRGVYCINSDRFEPLGNPDYREGGL